jgi:very-short-patch-repair endonuclease
MRSPLITIQSLGHIATRRQLLQRGHTGGQLTAAVRRAQIRRVRRGWYASPQATLDQTEAVRIGGRLSHQSAARHFGLWTGLDRRVHLTVTRGASRLRPRSGAVVHWVRPGRQDLSSASTWCVSLEECLRGMVRCAPREDAIACLDTAIYRYGLSLHRIRRIFASEPARSRAIAAAARAGSESGAESVVRQRLQRLGIDLRQQVQVDGVGRVDFVLDGWLVVEIDGFEYHSDPVAFERDRSRVAALVRLDRLGLQFSYRQVMFDWPTVEGTILHALRFAKQEQL